MVCLEYTNSELRTKGKTTVKATCFGLPSLAKYMDHCFGETLIWHKLHCERFDDRKSCIYAPISNDFRSFLQYRDPTPHNYSPYVITRCYQLRHLEVIPPVRSDSCLVPKQRLAFKAIAYRSVIILPLDQVNPKQPL